MDAPLLALSRKNFGTELAPYVYVPKTNISKKNGQKMFPFKMAAKKLIFVSQKKSRDQNLKKTTFSKKLFNEIYIYIFEIMAAGIFLVIFEGD